MLANCMMSKTRSKTNICICAELSDTLNIWRERFIMAIIILRSFEIFTSCQGSMLTFPKHYSKCKTVSIKFRKIMELILQERRLPILKFSQDNPQIIFWTFWLLKHFHNFTVFRGYPWNIFETHSWNVPRIFWKHYFVITLPKDQHLLLWNHTLLTQKQLFHRELLKTFFPLKCSLNVPWMAWTFQVNIPGILRAGWETLLEVSYSHTKKFLKQKLLSGSKVADGVINDIFCF